MSWLPRLMPVQRVKQLVMLHVPKLDDQGKNIQSDAHYSPKQFVHWQFLPESLSDCAECI